MPAIGSSGCTASGGSAPAGARPRRACFDLDDRPDAVPAGRHFVAEQVVARGAEGIADDVVLVAGELLANARQHASPPLSVCVRGDRSLLRVEVNDGSLRAPVRPTHSVSNMTGRGLALIEHLSSRWGVSKSRGGGKTVWAEFDADRPATVREIEDVDAVLAAWDDAELPSADARFTVMLGAVPTDLLIEAKAHIDNLVREFSLAAAAGEADGAEVPEHLARLIQTVVHGFADARDAIKRQALAAARRGDASTSLTLHLPVSAAAAGEAYLAALDEADGYARAARLLTLETPPDHRLFRRWYVQAVVRQLRDVAAGRPAEPVRPFEEVLVAEIRRLAGAQRVSERAARLQRVTAALSSAQTPEDVASVVVSEGVAALGASGGGLLVPAADGVHVAVPGVVGYDVELVGALREERLDAPLPAATALRTGNPVWLESQEERDREFPALRGFERNVVSMCALPLLVGGRTIGALRFSFNARRLFDEDERAFVLALAALTAQTLQRTELYEAEREAALELQRALLPERLVEIPGWDIASYYSPAGQQQVGGDFYDVVPVSGGRIAAVVGDVMGRGVSAAAAMAQIRSTIRAYAIDDPDPARVLSRVDAYFDALDVSQLVTALYALVEPDSDRLLIASAGHLDPLLVDGSGQRAVPIDAGTPFGVGGEPRRSTAVELPSGATLIAITDGLVERRGEDIDEGVQRVLDGLAGTAGLTSEVVVKRVVSIAAAERAHDDDVTVLVLRRL